MKKNRYSEERQKITNVIKYHDDILHDLSASTEKDSVKTEAEIAVLESIAKKLNINPEEIKAQVESSSSPHSLLIQQSWEQLCEEAEASVGSKCPIESIFTQEELKSNHEYFKSLNKEFNQLHKIDQFDMSIAVLAGIVSGAADILLVGIPQRGKEGLKAGSLSNYIRAYFEKRFPPDKMEKLANSKASKVPFDAQDNRNTNTRVEGLSAYYHRLLQLGHDPILGFIVGVMDIMTGKMTTIDKAGHIASQTMDNYADRVEPNIFKAIAKEIIHLKSDVTTSMGLPAPLMGLFNLLQFGSIGEEELTIAEIVQGMYYEGYDFIHFCASSIPVMLTEVIVRLGYAIKRIKEGHALKESIPFSLNREKHPKLATMLFIAHSAATAINAGKLYFSGNPVAINYPQWLAFAKYSYSQLKWGIINKPRLREAYISNKLNKDLFNVLADIDNSYEELSNNSTIIIG
jgi:hypothetical protein